MQIPNSTMVATMAGGPQIVTFALDDLLRRGEVVEKVIVVHLSPQADPLTGKAVAILNAEFSNNMYAGHPCSLQYVPVHIGGKKLDDIRDEISANAAWSTIFELVASLKAQGQRLHMCVAGGRRMLALLATSAAMIHFDHNDKLWHMYTPTEFLDRARDGAIMHARPRDGVRLIQVPLAPWGAYFPMLRTSLQASPTEIVAAQTQQLDNAERERCKLVAEQLTSRQLEALHGFAAGKSSQEIADAMCVTVKTVHAHKTVILDQCRNAWGLPEGTRLDYHFLRERFGRYFEQVGE
jgi:CRISPR-associated protein Csx14